MHDTSPEIAARVRRMLLERSGPERLTMGSRMFDLARTMVLASFPPGLSEMEIRCRLCERLYGDEVDLAGFARRLSSR
jgi:hypothetical protein